jgi:hypothetical protein
MKPGAEHPNWRGGEIRNKGYVYIHSPDHPRRDKRQYVKRAVLVVERTLGRFLLSSEHVHHRNEIKDDDRPENLEVLSPEAHSHRHPSIPPVLRGNLAPANKLTEDDVRTIRAASAAGEKQVPLANRFGVTQSTIWAIIHRRAWAWLD